MTFTTAVIITQDDVPCCTDDSTLSVISLNHYLLTYNNTGSRDVQCLVYSAIHLCVQNL